MASFNLGESNEAVVLNVAEVDTIIVPSAASDYRANNFQTEDRIDISGISETAQQLIETAQALPGAVRLIGSFGQLTLIGITRAQLREENFITIVNLDPVANTDSASTTEDIPVPIFVLDNDFDPDGQQLLLEGFQGVSISGGTVNRNDNGTPGDISDDFLFYTPAAGFFGTDSFSYSISDGAGGVATGFVNVTVEEGNTAPIAVPDVEITSSGVPVTIAVLDNDIDFENDFLSIVGVDQFTPEGGTVVSNGISLEYNPASGFTGIDSFNYTITDGEFSDTATVRVAVDMRDNIPPVAVEDTAFTTEDIPVSIAVLENDFDLDGDPLFVIGISAANGFVSISGNELLYNPAADFVGTDIFNYTIADNRGGTDTETVTVVVEEAPLPPIAQDDFSGTSEGIPVSIAVLNNDSDPDNGPQPLFISDFEIATFNGVVTSDGNNLVYTPDLGFTGTDSFSYTVSDGLSIDTATVTVTVDPVAPINQGPIAQDDFSSTSEGTPVSIAVLNNDSDPDNGPQPLFVFDFENITLNGEVTSDGNNLVYTPDLGFTGTDSFSYTVSDGLLTDTATVRVEVVDINVPPVAVDDFESTDEDIPVAIGVLDNDFDLDGDILEITDFAQTSEFGGNVAFDNNGTPFDSSDDSLVYTPQFGFTGTDSFNYTISDGQESDSATVTVAVSQDPNLPPIAEDDSATTVEEQVVEIDVLSNDSDPDGDRLSITGVETETTAGGTVTIDNNGSPFNPSDDLLVYEPGADFTGTDSFIYTISDGLETASATVTVTVEPINNPPVALPDFDSTEQNMDVAIAVLDNDFDIDGDILEIAGSPETTAEEGTVSLDETSGELVYSPAADFTGTDSFSYTIADGQGGTDTATVTVTVDPVINEAPIAADDTAMVTAGMDVTIAVLENDSDPDGPEDLSITGLSETEAGGTIVIEGETVVYTPPEVSETITDSFIYTISDGDLTDTATVNVTVKPENDPPIAADDTAMVTAGMDVTIAVLENDSDPDNGPQALSITELSATAAGGTVAIDEETVVYTPPEVSETITDSFTYSITDGLETSTATVTVTVKPDNEPPIAADDTTMVTAGMDVTIAVLENDSDPDNGPQALSITGLSETTEGGTITIDEETVVYTPPEVSEAITDSFTYSISDGLATSTATVTVTVEPIINQAPIAADDTAITTEGIAATIAVLDNDSDPDNSPSELSIVTEGFPIATDGGGTVSLDNGGTPFNPSDDSLVYEAADGFTGTDSFTYTISDGELTDTATVNVTVEPEPGNDPIAVDDTALTTEGIAATIAVLDNDFDPDGDRVGLTNFMRMTPSGGMIARDDNGTPNPADDSLVYTPADGFTGTDSFSYAISDDQGGTAFATVNVTVAPGNMNPIAVDDTALTTEGIAATIAVLDNDDDPDGDRVLLEGFEATTDNGTVTRENNGTPNRADDSLLYSPAEGFTGTDSFSYTIADGRGGTDTATVSVTVEPGNIPPDAVDDMAGTTAGMTVAIAVLDNDDDPDGDPLSVTGVSQTAAGGTVTPEDEGILVYSPVAGFTGTDSFSYTVDDGRGGTDTATVTVMVAEDNIPPIALPDITETVANSPAVIDVTDNDFDLDGDVIQLTDVSETTSAGGTVAIGDDNQVTYTPAEDFVGPDSFTYTISDGDLTDTATVTVAVTPGNADPVAVDDEAATTSGNPVTIMVLDNDSDPDGDPVLLEEFEATTANEGTVTLDNNGTPTDLSDDSLVYTASDTFLGTDSFAYSISDGQGGTASATVTVTVEAPFDPPVANGLNVVSRQDTTVRIPVLINDESADELLAVIDAGQPDSGTGETEVVENQVVYTPADGFIGDDSFSYSISDRFGRTATAVVDVNPQPLGDPLTGSPENDLIIGDDRLAEVPVGGGNIILETLQGQEGDDTLIGNEGADILVGGPGADEFVYLSLNDSNSTDIVGGDTIRDFNPTEDKIRLDFEIDGDPISNEDVTIGDLGIQFGAASILIEADPTFQVVLLLEPAGTIYTVGQIENSLEFGGIQ